VQDGDDPLVIGALRLQNGTITNFFRGAFDDFRIYDRVLRAEEIKLLGPDPEISITTQPQGYRIAAGATVTLKISATTVGIDAPLSYQWESDRSAVPDATNSSLVVTGVAGVTRNVRVRLNAGDLETFSNEVEIETVSPSDARLLLHLDFEEIIDGKLVNLANGETNVQILGTLSLLPGRVDEFGIGMDGLGYLQVPAAGSDLELVGSSYTIAWWMRQTRQGNTPLYALGDYLSPVRNGYAGVLHLGGAQFHAHHASSQTGGTIADPPLTLNLPRWTNWLHLAVVYNGAQRLIFTNGLLAASRPASGPIVGTGRDDLYIGSSSFGVLDDFRIYNYALASDELAALVNSAAPETRIQVSFQDGALLIRWPDAGAVQYRVDYSTTLGPAASWQPLTAPSQNSGGYIQVQPPTNGEARYFRLRKL
jgi:hypothetical protein